jgi:hypothetical protein
MQTFNWVCPHCNRAQTVTENRYSSSTSTVGIQDVADGSLALNRQSIACANPECKKLTLTITIGIDAGGESWRVDPKRVIFRERLLPRGASKPQPAYIPSVIAEDYYEACLIRDLSAKASATLTRRCLQGMIRDFAKISKGRLIDEIDTLRAAVKDGTADRSITQESIDAIDHVRGIGNIGAHMERDIDLIVPVDPGEAQALIELVEMLFDEWYGARARRVARLASIEGIAGEKKALKAALGATGNAPGALG